MRNRPWSGGVSWSGRSPRWLLAPAWIETPRDPDRHNRRAEWLVAIALTLLAGAATR